MKLFYLLVLAVSVHHVFSARILAVLPVQIKSHHIMFDAILKTLAEAGHEVVSFSAIQAEKKVPNLTVHYLEAKEPFQRRLTKEILEEMLNQSPIGSATKNWQDSNRILGILSENNNFLQLISSNEKFDLIILEAFFIQEGLFALGHKFNVPVINLQLIGTFSVVSSKHGNPLHLAYIPDWSLPYSDHMSFYERAISAYSILSTLYQYYIYYIPKQDAQMRELFKDPTLPPLPEIIQNHLSLSLTNAHRYVQYAQPYTPNIVPIGGIHLEKERKPLPPDMKKFVDEALEGVIYFSVGTILPDHFFSDEYFNNFLSVFRRLPQRVLWKTNQELKDLPSNVMTAKWTPQQDVLAHPNVKVFMTHGGLFSQHEAIHAGVPVVCTPYFADQQFNAKFYEDKGIGLILPHRTLSKETILAALSAVIKDPKYKDNMARMSRIYQDRPVSPAETLVYWVEYTLRHGGAQHLRPASATMPFYQLYLLDVVGTVIAALSLVIFSLYLTVIICIYFFQKKFKHYDSTVKDEMFVPTSKKAN